MNPKIIVSNLLAHSNSLSIEQINELSKDDVYYSVFTHKSYDAENNYELFEFLGDATLHDCLTWYILERFELAEVGKLTQLRSRLEDKKMFAHLAKKYNIPSVIQSCTEKKKSIFEDCFEAFFGATRYLVDTKFGNGYKVCYEIVRGIYNNEDISIDVPLQDPKSILKEIYDKKNLSLVFEFEKKKNTFHVKAIGNGEVIGEGNSLTKKEAEKKASEEALKNILV